MTPYGDDTRRILTGGTGGTNQINSWLARRINGQVMYGYNRITTSFTSGTSYAVAYSPSGVMTAWAVAASPYFYVTAWNADMGGTSFMTLPNPGTIPTGVGRSVSWHPSEQAVAVAHTTSPSVSVYPVNLPTTTTGVSGFGTKYANPAILPAGDGASVAFSPMGDFLAVASYSSPFIQVYPFDLSTGFGPKVADPAVLPTGGPHTYARIIAWRPQGDWIAMGLPNSPYLYLVPFNRATASFGIPVTLSGSNLPTTAISVVQFSPCGNYLLVGGVGGRGLDIYPFDAAAGILNASPTTFPATVTDQWRDAVFDRDGRTIYAVTSGSYVRTFTMPYRSQNWIRTNDV
jgi:WD40 repeat protein